MSAFDWFAVFACGAFVVAFSYYTNRPSSDDRSAWQGSTGSEDHVRSDVAAWRTRKTTQIAVETEPGDPYSDDRIELERMFIPHQRQPRKDQP